MARELYEKCSMCDGTTRTRERVIVNTGSMTTALPAGSPCICNRGPTPGFAPIGLTAGQVERVMSDRDALLIALWDLWDPDETDPPGRFDEYPSEARARELLAGRRGEIDLKRAQRAVKSKGRG